MCVCAVVAAVCVRASVCGVCVCVWKACIWFALLVMQCLSSVLLRECFNTDISSECGVSATQATHSVTNFHSMCTNTGNNNIKYDITITYTYLQIE